MPSPDHGAAHEDVGSRFRDRVRQWREQAILEAVAQLLADEGCVGLTMDDVARRVGIAKGSLYLHTNTRNALVSSLLDRWEEDVAAPETGGEAPEWERLERACASLFREVERGGRSRAPAFPCCLRTSPCPHGWAERWARVAHGHGLGSMRDLDLIGEAAQAVAATRSVRALLDADELEQAYEVVRRFLAGYVASTVDATS